MHCYVNPFWLLIMLEGYLSRGGRSRFLYKSHFYNCLDFMDFQILHHFNIFDSDNKQFVSVCIGRLPVVNI